jgi:SAM-dependent methyltransferase
MGSEFGAEYARDQLRRSRHPLRRLIKSFYIRNILREVTGPSVDFGCGAGQLLASLPAGSVGLEINPFLVESLRKKKHLKVMHYDADSDRFSLAALPENRYSAFIMAHVLEHFSDPAVVLRALLRSCRRLAIQRFILVLPGWKGYLSDSTHKTFVDRAYLLREGLLSCEGYRLRDTRYFPIDHEAVGRYFVFHELIAVLDRAA